MKLLKKFCLATLRGSLSLLRWLRDLVCRLLRCKCGGCKNPNCDCKRVDV